MSIQQCLDQTKDAFKKAVAHLASEFARLQAGRAVPSLVEPIEVENYGAKQPLKNLANISVPDAKTLQIQPWDKSMLAGIEKAIRDSGLGLNPVNNGLAVILNVPPLTEERRRDLVKVIHKMSEETKIAIRNSRQDAHNKFKQLKADSLITEDEQRGAEKKLQDTVDNANQEIDEMMKKKEVDIMKV